MATNNAINLKSSGIVSYDGAGAFTALANPLTVTNGGSGVNSNTAYAVLCGGTTSTNPIQSIASVGSIGNVLTSAGAGALPTFTSGNKGKIFYMWTTTGNPADATTYFMVPTSAFTSITASGAAYSRIYSSTSGTIKQAYGTVRVQGSLGSAQTAQIVFRLNNTTDTTIAAAQSFTAATNDFNNTALSIAVVAGDYFEIKVVCPTWTPTNPTTVSLSVSILMQ